MSRSRCTKKRSTGSSLLRNRQPPIKIRDKILISLLKRLVRSVRTILTEYRGRFHRNKYWLDQGDGLLARIKFLAIAGTYRRHRLNAEVVTSMLKKKGVLQDEIRSEHLAFVYKRLRRLDWSPRRILHSSLILDQEVRPGLSDETLWGVVIETREHAHLEHVVRNVHDTLGIPIQIFHGASTREFILSTSIKDLVDNDKVVLSPLAVDVFDAQTFNAFTLSEEFWYAMRGRQKILYFQTDAVVCSASSYRIEDFYSFDYIGPRWESKRPNNLVMDGGCGGLSLRDWSNSVECLRRFPPHYWEGGEDTYFAFHLPIMGGQVGDRNECARFATQYNFVEKSFGAHQITLLRPSDLIAFLKYAPEARPLVQSHPHAHTNAAPENLSK